MSEPERVRLYLSTEHPCGYLADRPARNAYLDPEFALNPPRYGILLSQGFRRSGVHVYRPHCPGCKSCLPARLRVKDLHLNRTQRRCLARNQDLQLAITHTLTDEHFELYGRYLQARHAGCGMDGDNREAFHAFLECQWNDTEFWEFRLGPKLMALAVVDVVPTALSAVYTFFEPDEKTRSLGTYAVLKQAMIARERQLEHLYLGYWVPDSKKMDYKSHFQPLEILIDNRWRATNIQNQAS